jgi:hypothetical protein
VDTVEELEILFNTDYQEFVKNRKRWKSDFDAASKKATENFEQIEGILNTTMS